jgi:hypothetical protein
MRIAAKIDVQGVERSLGPAWPYSMRRMGGDISAVIAFLTEHFQEGSI